MTVDKDLNIRQKRFADEFLVDLNATQAAIRAGYSEKTAQEQGSRLLSNVMVQQYIEAKQKELEIKTGITQEWVLNHFKQIFERCMQEEPVLDKKGEPTGQFKFDAANANRSLELIGKHLGMFKERVEHTGKDGQAIKYANITAADRTQRIDAILDRGRDRRDSGSEMLN